MPHMQILFYNWGLLLFHGQIVQLLSQVISIIWFGQCLIINIQFTDFLRELLGAIFVLLGWGKSSCLSLLVNEQLSLRDVNVNALLIVEVHLAIKLVYRHPTFNNLKKT